MITSIPGYKPVDDSLPPVTTTILPEGYVSGLEAVPTELLGAPDFKPLVDNAPVAEQAAAEAALPPEAVDQNIHAAAIASIAQ